MQRPIKKSIFRWSILGMKLAVPTSKWVQLVSMIQFDWKVANLKIEMNWNKECLDDNNNIKTQINKKWDFKLNRKIYQKIKWKQ